MARRRRASHAGNPRYRSAAASTGTPLTFGPSIEVHAVLDSTMDVLAAAAREGAPEGSVVIADYQRAGRGRLRRAWLAAPGTALMLSMLFRPDPSRLPPERTHELGMAVGLAAYDALRSRLPADSRLQLKWPNDLLVEGKKIAGLLAEATWARAATTERGMVIVGIGINVRQSAHDLPEGATSLAEILDLARSFSTSSSIRKAERQVPADNPEDAGAEEAPAEETPAFDPLDRSLLAADLLVGIEAWHARLNAGESLVGIWSERLETLGRRVVARRADEVLEGIAEGVERDGALRIRLADGRVERIHAGDVTLAPL
jgi:BirA family biotin operon repressor/biotin-[acetyl-CoA-carboxylase] ligase